MEYPAASAMQALPRDILYWGIAHCLCACPRVARAEASPLALFCVAMGASRPDVQEVIEDYVRSVLNSMRCPSETRLSLGSTSEALRAVRDEVPKGSLYDPAPLMYSNRRWDVPTLGGRAPWPVRRSPTVWVGCSFVGSAHTLLTAAGGQLFVDCRFWGGRQLWHDAPSRVVCASLPSAPDRAHIALVRCSFLTCTVDIKGAELVSMYDCRFSSTDEVHCHVRVFNYGVGSTTCMLYGPRNSEGLPIDDLKTQTFGEQCAVCVHPCAE